MKIKGTVWLRQVVDKLILKHNVTPYEVEEALILSARDMARKERKQYERK